MTCYDSAVHRPHPALLVLRGAALVALTFSMATLIEYFGGRGTFCEPGGDCEVVRRAGLFGGFLPHIGVLGFTALFVSSSMKGARVQLVTSAAAMFGGAGALYFIYLQGVVIGAWCWLCLAVDASALVAAGAGVFILAAKIEPKRLAEGLLNPWWAPFWIAALAPLVLAKTMQDPPLPGAIRALHDESAEVNIVEMADFECSFCREMHPALRDAIEESGAGVNLVRIVVPLEFHEHARAAARAYFCAGDDSEAMADALFASDDLTHVGLAACASRVGLDGDEFEACLEDEATEARVQDDLDLSERAGMRGLPSVYIGEWTMVGFDVNAGSAPYAAAIAAARNGAGRRILYWPGVLMVVLAGASLVIGLRKDRGATPK